MQQTLLIIITTLVNILSLLVIIDAILSWFVSPFSPIRGAMGRILQPMYAPIRKIIPPLGGMDFTPIVLLLLLRVISQIAVSILS